MNILIIPCSTQIGVEQFKSLKYNKHFSLFGASHNNKDELFTNFIKLQNNIESKEDFIKEIISIKKHYNIDIILPAHDEIQYILKNVKELEDTIPGSPLDTVNVCRYKSKTYEALKNTKFVPKYSIIKKDEIFLKPDKGQGTRKTFKIDEQYVSCEYLSGKEYTVDCFSNTNGEILYVLPRERTTINNGISELTTIVHNNIFNKIAIEISNKIILNGAWFFQVKEDLSGNLKLLEVATRIGGASGISRVNGVNLTGLLLYQHIGKNIKILNQNIVTTFNRKEFFYDFDYNTIFLDYDDTFEFVINHLNSLNKNIIIITRNKEVITKFKTIYVDENTKKSEVINREISNDRKAIFIDDSFKELEDVYSNCNIFSISIENVEYLK